MPGGQVSGYGDLQPGRSFHVDPLAPRGYQIAVIDGKFAAGPAADLTVTPHGMTIDLPDSAITTKPVRWKIEHTGVVATRWP